MSETTGTFKLACFGLPLAPYLLARDGHTLTLAVLSPVQAPGRRRLARLLPAERRLDALELGDELTSRVDRALAEDPPDLIVSWFWTRLLPARWLERARAGAIGAHPSLLPKYRGPNPYFASIDAGDPETGVTLHRLTPRYDDGDTLLTSRVPVGDRDSWQLARALDRPSLALVREAVRRLARGEQLEGSAQREAEASYAPEPEGEALRVDWRWPTERVLRRVRALAPVPGLALDVEGLAVVAVRACAAVTFPEALAAGEGAVVGDPETFVLRTGDGAVAVERGFLEPGDGEESQLLSAPELARVIRDHLSGRRARP